MLKLANHAGLSIFIINKIFFSSQKIPAKMLSKELPAPFTFTLQK